MSDQQPTELAPGQPPLDQLLERLFEEIPAQSPASPAEPPSEAADSSAGTATQTSLNIPEEPPLEQQRECIFYGLDDSSGPLPDSRFTAVIFPIGRYRFAVPLNMLDGIARVEDEVTELPGQPAWHRGLVRHRGQQLTLVDLAALLGLEDVPPPETPDHLLVLPGGRAGIVCDETPEPFEVTGDRIRWSSPLPHRPWLAAVLPDRMCVLMDVEDIARRIGHESCL